MIDYTQWDIEDFIDNESFVHYVLRDNTHDVETWEHIIKNHPEIADTVKKTTQVLEMLSHTKKPEVDDIEEKLKHFRYRMILTPPEKAGWNNNILRVIRRSLPYAASILLLITIGIGVQMFLENLNKNQLCKVIVGKGQKSIVILPDNTKVWLNSESELTYPASFGTSRREVSLVGEAYFSVTHDKKHPFLVNTSEIKVKVYGTEFNLKCYKGEQTVETTLVKGSLGITVKGNTDIDEVLIRPNEQYIYYKSINIASKKTEAKEVARKELKPKSTEQSHTVILPRLIENLNPKLITAWKEQRLIFNNESFADLAIKLERWYDVKVIINSERIKQYRYKGTFENETVDQAISALKIATPFNFVIEKRTIYITE